MKALKTCILCLVLLLSMACDKAEKEPQFFEPWDKAEITAQDINRCRCCGGYFISIDKQTYRTFALPPDFLSAFKKDLNRSLPLKVYLRWEALQEPDCPAELKLIRVFEMQAR
jgi:hypothetical protein